MKAAASIKSFFVDKRQNKNIEIILINIIIQLYIFRTTLPVFKYAFIGLFPLVFLYIIYSNRNKIVKSIRETIGQLKLVIILITIFFIAFVFSGIFYEIIFVDLINAIVLIVLFYLLILLLENKRQLNYFTHVFIHLVLVSALFVIIFQWTSLFSFAQDQADTSEVIDRNFALLPLFFSVFGVFYFYIKKLLPGILNLSYTVLLVFFTLHIFLSGSRRGLVLISFFIILLFLTHIISLIYNNLCIKRICRLSKFYILSLIILSGIFYFFISQTSCWIKNRTLENLGVENIHYAKRNITIKIFSYASFFQNEIKYSDLHEKIWDSEHDPRDPDCGWGGNTLQRVYPLTGKNIEIIPDNNSIGCLIDSSSFHKKNKYKSWQRIKKLKVAADEKYTIELYCYVSENFDGIRVMPSIPFKFIKEKIVKSKTVGRYDLDRKGIWQKLIVEIKCENAGEIWLYFLVQKNRNNDGQLNGEVIFAYPVIHKVDTTEDKDSIAGNMHNTKNKVLYKSSLINIESLFKIFNNQLRDIDTASLNIEKDIGQQHDPNHVIQGRTERWKFAWHLFKNEYNWKNKLFGKGFNYLSWYGAYFYEGKRIDWPHNPFLSVLLYSGILGLVFYLFVLYKAVFYYIKYIKEYYIFFIFFLITFFFAFFSVNSPFVPPVWGFLLIFPFFLHSVLKKEEVNDLKSDH